MVALAREGDPGCQRVIADAGHTVGRIAAALCNQFNPERIVVGGELALAGDLLLDPMRESIRRYAIPAAAEDLTVVAGALGDRAELWGLWRWSWASQSRCCQAASSRRPGGEPQRTKPQTVTPNAVRQSQSRKWRSTK